MNALKFALSATAALVLAACGNGGTYQPDLTHAPTVQPKPSAPPTTGGNAGGSSSANNAGGGTSSGSPATGGSATPNTGNAGTQPSTPPSAGTQPSTQPPAASGGTSTPSAGNTAGSQPSAGNNTPSTPSGKYTGHFVSGNTALQGENKMIANDEYNQISVNGVLIQLPAGTSATSFPIASSLGVADLTTAKDLKHAVYGLAQDYAGLPENTRFAFVQGEESKTVPTSGTVRYKGAAHFFKNVSKTDSVHKLVRLGDVALSADFGNKTLKGLVESMDGNFPLSATIKGSKFEGMDDREGWETKGAFYGPDAAEVAGTFRNLKNQTNPTVGVFGAKKADDQ